MSHELSRRQKNGLLGAVNDPDGMVELSLGDRAVTKGYLTADALKSCLEEQTREPRMQLGQILVKRGYMTKAQLAELIATRESFPAAFIGRFRLRRALSRGGMGVVYEAEDSLLRRRVAVKVLREDAGLPASLKERLQREAVAIARLRHPNIVALYEYGSEGGLHYLVMEMVDGQTLAQAMHSFKRAHDLAAAFMARVCEAIAYAHEQGVIHRDLKPKNIMIDAQGVPKVVDFGLSIIEDASSVASDGLMAGTLAYMPPEQLSGTSHTAQPAWDVYALGATLYEMLTGRLPFPGATTAERMGSILTRQILPPSRYNPAIPHALEAIVFRALDRDPRQRYATAGDMALELRHYLGGGRVEAEGDWKTNVLRSLRANKRKLIAAGVLTVAMIVTIVLSWSAWSSGRSSGEDLIRAARADERARSALEMGDQEMAAVHADQAGDQSPYWQMRVAIARDINARAAGDMWMWHDAVESTPLHQTKALTELRQGARAALDKVQEDSLEQWKRASLPGLRALVNGDYVKAAQLLDVQNPQADANLSYAKAYALLRAHRCAEACSELEATFLKRGIHQPSVVALYARAVAALAIEEGLGYDAIKDRAERVLALPSEAETHAALADLRSVLAQRALSAGRPDIARRLLEEATASEDRAAAVRAASTLFDLLVRSSPGEAEALRVRFVKETEKALQWADAALCVAYVSFLANTGPRAPVPMEEAAHLIKVAEVLPPAVRDLPSVAMDRAEALSRLGRPLGAWELARSIRIPPEEVVQRLRLFDLLLSLARRETGVGANPDMLNPARAQLEGIIPRGMLSTDAQLAWGEYWHAVATSRVRRNEDASDPCRRTLEAAAAAISAETARSRGHHLRARVKILQSQDPRTPEADVPKLLQDAERECTIAFQSGLEEAQMTRGQVQRNRAIVEWRAGRLDQTLDLLDASVKDLDEACQRRPDKADWWTCCADARIKLGQALVAAKQGVEAQKHFEEAVANATKALGLRDKEVRALEMRAAALELCGRFRDAQADLRVLVQVMPERRAELEKWIQKLD